MSFEYKYGKFLNDEREIIDNIESKELPNKVAASGSKKQLHIPITNRLISTCQYSILPDDCFSPTSTTINKLPAAVYTTNLNGGNIFFRKKEQNVGDLIKFENTIIDILIKDFENFWKLKNKYKKMGEIHKRGYLLWGPPGGGKTSLINILKDNFVKMGNIVIDFNSNTMFGVRTLRMIEPNRKIMVCLEDIDGWVNNDTDQSTLLNFLDGDSDFDNIVIIATTNYPEALPDRIINRPSRFDRVEYVGFPSKKEREIYLKKKSTTINGDMSDWLHTTKNWTFAHIKELLLSVEVYGLDFQTTVDRINKMRKKDSNSKNYFNAMRGQKSTVGF